MGFSLIVSITYTLDEDDPSSYANTFRADPLDLREALHDIVQAHRAWINENFPIIRTGKLVYTIETNPPRAVGSSVQKTNDVLEMILGEGSACGNRIETVFKVALLHMASMAIEAFAESERRSR